MSTQAEDTRMRELVKSALLKLEEANKKLKAKDLETREPIAIVGVGCRLPGGVNGPDEFYEKLLERFHPVERMPAAKRFDVERYLDTDPERAGSIYVGVGSFVRDIELFDAAFFGISPREAELMDPQHRILLEVVWEALERAAMVPKALRGSRTGVYVGLMAQDYAQLTTRSPEIIGPHTGAGTSLAVAAGRLSYTFGFEGPAMTLDTACSSSLVAVHLACQGLLNGDADLAIAAGANLMLSPVGMLMECRSRILSPDGVCRTFDAAANGTVRGEGVGAVVLKRLSHAQRDGDPIVAVIRGSAVNQDGRSSGLTVPNGPAQTRVIKRALERAGVSPREVGYVEAHGTATPLGDPIEVEALGHAYGRERPPELALRIGSVKTNLGHLEGAAGIAGLIKAVLCVQHGRIPAHLHLQTPTPHVAWADHALTVPREEEAWPEGYRERIAAVSSFGFSGTNAHVIVSAAPSIEASEPQPTEPLLLPLSAGSEAGLRLLARQVQTALASVSASDLCHTLQKHRTQHAFRKAFVGRDAAELTREIDAFLASEPGQIVARDASGPVFLFTGQGAQRIGMARALFEESDVFRAAFERCEAHVQTLLGFRLRDVLYDARAEQAALDQTLRAQPALFAVGYALFRLWHAQGVTPRAVFGYSLGEYLAAHVAGVLELDDALTLVCQRARLMQALAGRGAMASVDLTEADARRHLAGHEHALAIAAVTSAQSVVLSGDDDALTSVLERIGADGVRVQRLRVSHAFHSPQMDAMLAPFREVLEGMQLKPAQLPLVCNLTGKVVTTELCSPEAWVSHVREPVRFAEALDTLQALGHRVLVEIGPRPTLLGMVQQGEHADRFQGVPTLRGSDDDALAPVRALGALYEQNALASFETRARARRVAIPTYPFDRKPYWAVKENRWFGEGQTREKPGLAFMGERVRSAALTPGTCVFELTLSALSPSFLGEHRVLGRALMPATGIVELALCAGQAAGMGRCGLQDLSLKSPMWLDDEPTLVQVLVGEEREGARALKIFSVAQRDLESPFTLHAEATLRSDLTVPAAPELQSASAPTTLEPSEHFRFCLARGLEYGPSFRGLTDIRLTPDHVEASVAPSSEVARERGSFILHPAVLDACLQTFAVAASQPGDERTFLPVGMERVILVGQGLDVRRVRLVRRQDVASERPVADVWLFDADDGLVGAVLGLCARPVTSAETGSWQTLVHETTWHERALPDLVVEQSRPQRWVVFLDDRGVGPAIADALRAQGEDVLTVARGLSWGTPSRDRITLTPRRPDHYAKLVDTAKQGGKTRVGFVYTWGLDGGDPRVDSLDNGMRHVLLGAQLLAQALASQSALAARLVFVTRGAQSTGDGADCTAPLEAMLWGFAQTLRHELGLAAVGAVDLDGEPSAAASIAPWLVGFASEDRLAVRHGRFFVPRLVPAHLRAEERLAVRDDASYLISGGTGALGLRSARWLLERGARHVVLLSRRSSSQELCSELSQLERAFPGARLECASGDVTDRRVVAALVARLPKLRGIVHAAGALADGLVPRQSWADLERVLKPKLEGLWQLLQATRARQLDFMVLYGSLVGTLGNPGQAGYAAANASLDAFAHHLRGRGISATSVAWGSWGSLGMAGRVAGEKARGHEALDPERAFAALDALLAAQRAQAALAALDMGAWLEAHPVCLRQGLFAEAVARAAPSSRRSSSVRARLDGAPRGDVADIVRDHVAEQVGAVLKLDPIEVKAAFRRNLLETGMDSLMAVELKNRLARNLERALPATLVFFQPTPQALTTFLVDLELEARGAEKKDAPAESFPKAADDMSAQELERLIESTLVALQ